MDAAPEVVKPQTSQDLVRLSKSKEIVDLSPNTLRTFHKRGLAFYRTGKIVFFSQSELSAFIRGNYKVAGGEAV